MQRGGPAAGTQHIRNGAQSAQVAAANSCSQLDASLLPQAVYQKRGDLLLLTSPNEARQRVEQQLAEARKQRDAATQQH